MGVCMCGCVHKCKHECVWEGGGGGEGVRLKPQMKVSFV